jgi:hypothetical protein
VTVTVFGLLALLVPGVAFGVLVLGIVVCVWPVGLFGRRCESGRSTSQGMLSTVRDLGATPLLVDLPIEGEIGLPDSGPIEEERFSPRYYQERGVPSVDRRPAFMAAAAQGVRFKTYGHSTAAEHRLGATTIGAHFDTTRILPGAPLTGASSTEARLGRPRSD